MARHNSVNKTQAGTFVTNDWRQLNSGGDSWTTSEDVNGLFSVDGSDSKLDSPMAMRLAQDIALLKNDNQQIKMAVYELQRDRDNLRTAIRKLKVENTRIKARLKRVTDVVKTHSGIADKMDIDNEEDVDYEDLRQFLLIGGPKDPFALQYNDATIQDIKDPTRIEHKSCERYYWYKLAEFFDDKEAMQKVLDAKDSKEAEDIVSKDIKGFNQVAWDGIKAKYWEEAQRLKLDQHRWIRNLLVKTGSMYIAVASSDKVMGTGWRKMREEASRTQLWDGENQGGKVLMKLREELTANHSWTSPAEEQEALQKFNDFKRTIWKPYGPGRLERSVGRLTVGTGPRRGGLRGAAAAAQSTQFPPPLSSLSPRPPGGSKETKKKRRQI